MRRTEIIRRAVLRLCSFSNVGRALLALVKLRPKRKMKWPMKLAIGCGVMLVFSVGFCFVAFPRLIKMTIKKQINLKPGNEIRGMFLKIPFPLEFKVYIFNVTNPEEVQNGALPIVEEVGPYCYEEWKKKVSVTDNEADDTMEYNPVDTFIYNQTKTGKLTGDEIVTIPHPMIVGLMNMVAATKPAMLSLVSKAANVIYRNPTSVFLTARVKDILWDGVVINCTVTDFAAKAVCTQLKTEAKELKHIGDNDLSFALLGPKNGTEGKRLKVRRGSVDHRFVGSIIEYDGKEEMEAWSTTECNKYHGSDGTIFPPLMTPEEGLWSFAPDLCRSMKAVYVGDTKYLGVKVRKYVAGLGDMSANEDEKCYCPTPDTCMSKGLMDLAKCGQPVIASLPHFYDTNGEYVRQVKGMRPSAEQHSIEILFEGMTGSPVQAFKRLQFSIPLHPYAKVPLMKNLPETVIPLVWVEESVSLNMTYVGQIKTMMFVISFVGLMKWLLLVGSIAGLGASAYFMYIKRDTIDVTPTPKIKPEENGKTSVISLVNPGFINDDGNTVLDNHRQKF